MWVAEPRRRAHGTRGVTLIETTLVVALLGGLSLLTSQSLSGVRDSTDTMATFRRAQRGGERTAYEVHRLVSSARKLFVRGSMGNGYVSALALDWRVPAPGARLPLPEEYEPLGRDSANLPQTGNMLLFAVEADPITCPANPATSKMLYVDAYRMVCVYPTVAARRIAVQRAEGALDLVVWQSAIYPSWGQVMGIANATERTRVVRALYSVHGCRYLWNPDETAEVAFFRIDATGSISTMPERDHELPEDRAVSPGGRLVYTNLQLARTDPTVAVRRSVLTVDDPEDWVPNGFEVKIAGNSSQRKVWMRLVVEGQSVTTRDAAHETVLIAAIRDL